MSRTPSGPLSPRGSSLHLNGFSAPTSRMSKGTPAITSPAFSRSLPLGITGERCDEPRYDTGNHRRPVPTGREQPAPIREQPRRATNSRGRRRAPASADEHSSLLSAAEASDRESPHRSPRLAAREPFAPPPTRPRADHTAPPADNTTLTRRPTQHTARPNDITGNLEKLPARRNRDAGSENVYESKGEQTPIIRGRFRSN